MNAAILLSGIKITSPALYRRYFCFPEVYTLLRQDAYAFRRFLQEAFPLAVSIHMFGLSSVQGTPRPGAPADLLRDPQRCLEPAYAWLFSSAGSDGGVTVLIDNLQADLLDLYRDCRQEPEDAACYEGCADPTAFQASLQRILLELTHNGQRRFSCEGAAEVYFYCLLHTQAGLLPDADPAGLQALRKDLDCICPLSPEDLGQTREILFQKQIELPFYTGGEALEGPIELVRLYNSGTVCGRVTLAGTVVSRVLPPQTSVCALRRAGRYLSFLPRAALVGETLLKLENGRLSAASGGQTRYLPTAVTDPACWAHSNEYGTFILDLDGRLDRDSAWPDPLPDQPAAAVSAFGDHYCILLSDGSTTGWPCRTGWQQVIDVYVGMNAAIALDNQRMPIWPDGRPAAEIQAVSASALDHHYICLTANGTVKTDSGLTTAGPVRAAAICPKGYLTAEKGYVRLYSFENQKIQEWVTGDVTELIASEKLAVWFDAASGAAVSQRL